MIKLNIQRFSSTNKTTHYELSQYVSSDLPTYLVDYNGDMSKIDTAINTAQTTADTASTAATNAATAASTAQTTANTAITNAATAQSSANEAISNVGTLANLETAVKTSTVAAINEVVGNVGNKSTLETTAKTNLVSAINEIFDFIHLTDKTEYNVANLTSSNGTYVGTLTLKKDSTGKVFKLHGSISRSSIPSGLPVASITISNTGLTPDSTIEFSDIGVVLPNVNNTYRYPRRPTMTVSPNGTVTIEWYSFEDTTDQNCLLFECLYILN